jgi:hypothetical protein
MIRADIRRLKDMPPRYLMIRFAFGAAISVIAGAVSIWAGARAGGLFLAFPAILPATLTLIQKEESKRKAKDDDKGATLGGVGLVAFAAVSYALLPGHPAWVALGAAALAWLAVSVGLFLLVYGRRM